MIHPPRRPRPQIAIVPWAFVCALLGALPITVRAQDVDKTPNTKANPDPKSGEAKGPHAARVGRFLVGDPAPDIELTDESGARYRLGAECKKRPQLIAFARYPEDAIQVEMARAGLDSAGIGAIVVAPFRRDRLHKWVSAPAVRFLYDRASHIARTYGMFDAVTSNPQPGAMLIDERQRIVMIVSGIMLGSDDLVTVTRDALSAARADAR